MYGTPASEAILATFSAMVRACDSDSMTQGPAMRKSALPAPRRKGPRVISLDAFMELSYHNTLNSTSRSGFGGVHELPIDPCNCRSSRHGDVREPSSGQRSSQGRKLHQRE